MGRSRMFDHEEPGSSENQSPRTTIVGGRPPESRGDLPPVPTGIQKLLRLAGEDDRFRRLLLKQRANVAHAAGIELTSSEKAILAAVPERQLEGMIAKVPPAAPDRREFFRQSAASAVILLGGATLGQATSGCEKQPGSAVTSGPFASPPEDEPPRPEYNAMEAQGGAAPDEPPVRPDCDDQPEEPTRPDHHHMAPGGARPDTDAGPAPLPKIRGIRPDVPPPRPDRSDTVTGGGAAPDMPPE